MARSLVLLGLLLGLHCAFALPTKAIIEKYGVCPTYNIQSGDIVFDIAQKLGVDQVDLINSIQACGVNASLLQIGADICLPGYDNTLCTNIVRTDPARSYCQVYVVQEGDTTASVAKKLGISEQELIDLNSDYLNDGYTLPFAGQYIRTPGWNQVECRDFNDNDRPMCQMYVVRSGDSATAISQKYKVDLNEMLQLNGLTADATLPLNFRLKLPKWNESCPAQGIPAVLPADTVNCRVTVLGQGESLALLAQRYLTTLMLIQSVNPSLTNATLLQPGTYVNLPPFGPSCVGKGNLVDVPTGGDTALPDTYDYNGLSTAPANPPPTDAVPPAEGGAEAPTAAPIAPVPLPAPAVESPPPAAAPVAPAPVGAPPSGASTAAVSVLAAVAALLAGVLAL